MINFSVPTLYAGIYDMTLMLDTAQRYFPELRRWKLVETRDDGTRVLFDEGAAEVLEIPPFHFAIFIAGEAKILPFDTVALMMPPNPRFVIPKKNAWKLRSTLLESLEDYYTKNNPARVVSVGAQHQEIFLDFPNIFPNVGIPGGKKTYDPRLNKEYHLENRIKLNGGDTLFAYMYPREIDTDKYLPLGALDYMPTSMTEKRLSVAAIDAFDFSGDVYSSDWTQMQAKQDAEKKDKYVAFGPVDEDGNRTVVRKNLQDLHPGSRTIEKTELKLVPKSLQEGNK